MRADGEDRRGIHPGHLIAGQYRIEQPIGAGGMGEVYRAQDERLHRPVAIKVLHPNLGSDATARQRFVRETRLACRVSHPYVATVFNALDHDDQVLLVMEYIAGQTLTQALRQSPSKGQTLAWSMEIAEALAAIHRAGLVHRDLKPGNVMISSDNHVKVMDFGLARIVPAEVAPDSPTLTQQSRLTREGAVTGTPGYMSPEQILGQPVDQRSDQFSFGVVLYEALTGVHPFIRPTIAGSASATLTEPPPEGSHSEALNEPPGLRRVVMRLLEKDPARRFAQADEMHAALREVVGSAADLGLLGRFWTARRFGLILVMLAATVLAGGWWLTRPPSWDRPRYAFAVAPFEDHTGAESGPADAAIVAGLLATDLQASRLVRAQGPAETQALLRGLPPDLRPENVVRRVVSGTAVDYVLVGNLYREGARYVATVEFEEAREGVEPMPALRESAASPLRLAERLASGLRRRLPGVSRLNAMRDDRIDLAEITSRSKSARTLHEQGFRAMREDRLLEAIRFLRDAVKADGGFALAHADLAQALHRAGYGRLARESADAAHRLAPGARSRAAERLSLLIAASRAEVFGRSDEAVTATAALAELFPDEPTLLAGHARALQSRQAYADGLAWIDRAIVLDPRSPTLRLSRAELLIASDRDDDAFRALDESEALFRLIESKEGLAAVDVARGWALDGQERWADSVEAYTRAAELYAEVGRDLSAAEALLEVANLQIKLTRLAVAGSRVADAEATARSVGNLRLLCNALSAKAVVFQYQGDYDKAEEAYRAAIDQARRLGNARLMSSPLSNYSSLLVWLGRVEDARPLVEESVRVARELGRSEALEAALVNSAEIAARLGDLDEAVRTYEILREQTADDRMIVFVNPGLGEIHRLRGELGEALRLYDANVEYSERRDLPMDLGRALVNRADLQSRLGRREAALVDIERAEAIAKNFPDLERAALLFRGRIAADAGAWSRAMSLADRHPGKDDTPSVMLLACRAALELGQTAKAIETCTRMREESSSTVADRVEADSLIARALVMQGDTSGGLSVATGALAEAERMRLQLLIAQTAAVVVTAMPRGADEVELMRQKGRDALARYLQAAPTPDRDAVADSLEFQRLSSQFAR